MLRGRVGENATREGRGRTGGEGKSIELLFLITEYLVSSPSPPLPKSAAWGDFLFFTTIIF
jgi:hypothetical protein